jgi:hypothetical protein
LHQNHQASAILGRGQDLQPPELLLPVQVAPSNPADVTFDADAEVDYCSEAAAYEHLACDGQTRVLAPEYL